MEGSSSLFDYAAESQYQKRAGCGLHSKENSYRFLKCVFISIEETERQILLFFSVKLLGRRSKKNNQLMNLLTWELKSDECHRLGPTICCTIFSGEHSLSYCTEETLNAFHQNSASLHRNVRNHKAFLVSRCFLTAEKLPVCTGNPNVFYFMTSSVEFWFSKLNPPVHHMLQY